MSQPLYVPFRSVKTTRDKKVIGLCLKCVKYSILIYSNPI